MVSELHQGLSSWRYRRLQLLLAIML